MGKNRVHIGQKIKEVVDRSHLTKVAFAKSINLTRDAVYKIFEKETIDTAQLQKISTVLEHDFFRYYHATPDSSVAKESKGEYGYVSKEEVSTLTRAINTLVFEVEKLRGVHALNAEKTYKRNVSTPPAKSKASKK